MSKWDRNPMFPASVTERTPEVAYEVWRWLTEEAPPSFTGAWLAAAFAAAPGSAILGKVAPARSFR
jgi:hypothetical protein